MYFGFQVECFHPAPETFRNLALESRIGMNNVPTFGHELCASGYMEIPEYPVQSHRQEIIHKAQIQAKKEYGNDNHNRGTDDFLTAGPRDFFHLVPNVVIELLRVLRPVFN